MPKYNIVIPTLGRVDRQKTYDSLPDSLKEKTILVVRKFEAEEHRKRGRKVLVLPDYVSNIGETSDWILNSDLLEDTIMLVDDDLRLSTRREKSESGWWRYTKSSHEEMEQYVRKIYGNTKKYTISGLLERSVASRKEKSGTSSRIIGFVAYQRSKILELGVSYWDGILEDIKLCIDVLLAGGTIYDDISATYSETQWSEGGCSTHRTVASHEESVGKLHEMYPDFTKIVIKKKYGEERKELKVNWRKINDYVQSKKH